MLFCLGLLSLGVAHLLTGERLRGIVPVTLGLLGAAAVRPHFAGIAAIALVGAFLVKRPAPSLGQLAPLVKLVTLVGVVVVAVILPPADRGVPGPQRASGRGGLTSVEGVRGALGQATIQTETGVRIPSPRVESPGGSRSLRNRLVPAVPLRSVGGADPYGGPRVGMALGAVLHPVPMGVGSGEEHAAATVRGVPHRVPHRRHHRAHERGELRDPARQRTVLLPALLVLVSIPPQRLHRARHPAAAAQEVEVVGAGTG